MKEMVRALHDAGIGVVMIVVDNHTANNDAPTSRSPRPDTSTVTAPTAPPTPRAAATDVRPRMKHFIVNSVKYWADEYHTTGSASISPFTHMDQEPRGRQAQKNQSLGFRLR